jgi:hypothetical protein
MLGYLVLFCSKSLFLFLFTVVQNEHLNFWEGGGGAKYLGGGASSPPENLSMVFAQPFCM